MARHLGWWFAVPAYMLASYVAISRLPAKRHWLSDTFLGAAIGTACGYAVVHLHDAEGDGEAFNLIPTPTGLTAVWVF